VCVCVCVFVCGVEMGKDQTSWGLSLRAVVTLLNKPVCRNLFSVTPLSPLHLLSGNVHQLWENTHTSCMSEWTDEHFENQKSLFRNM